MRTHRGSAEEPAEQRLLPGFAVDGGDGFGQRNIFGAGLHAVLRVGAFLDAAFAEQSLDAFLGVHRAGRVHVEEAHLADDCRADEFVACIHLRADFQATATRNAARKRIALFLNFGRNARTFAEAVGAVDGNPGLYALQAFEHELAIHSEIAHQWKFAHGLDADRLLEFIHQRGAGHADLAVDHHGAGAADFFQAIGVIGDGRGFFAVASDGIFRDVAQADDDVHRGAPAQGKFLPMRWLAGSGLPLDANDDLFVAHSSSIGIRKPADPAERDRQQQTIYFAASYLRTRGGISEMSTGS